MPRFDAVLFDLDGTLLDSIALILASYHHTLEKHGLPRPDDAVILEGLGTPLEAGLAQWVDDPRLVPAMVETYVEHNLAMHDAMVRPYDGVCELVHALRADGRRLAIVTSKRRTGTVRGLRAIGLEHSFDVLVCAGDTPRAKPHPDPVHHALAELGIANERAVFVGDSTHDMRSGRAAGVHTAAVLWGPFSRASLEPTSPSVFAENAEELRRYLFARG